MLEEPLLQEIEARLKDMTEEQKQKVIDSFWGESSDVCDCEQEAV